MEIVRKKVQEVLKAVTILYADDLTRMVEIDSFEGCTTKTIAQKVNVNGAKIIGLDGDTSLDRTAKIIKSGDRSIRFLAILKSITGVTSRIAPHLSLILTLRETLPGKKS